MSETAPHLLPCEPARHAEQIRAIFNDAILHTTDIYDHQPRSREVIDEWFASKVKGGYPVIGAENDAGELMGFGTYGPFRTWPGYRYSVEHSIYVDARFRRQGLGRRLLQELIASAQQQDYHMMVGGIDAGNLPSIRLHETMGFVYCGTIREAGFKFGRWLDVVFYQLILPPPQQPPTHV